MDNVSLEIEEIKHQQELWEKKCIAIITDLADKQEWQKLVDQATCMPEVYAFAIYSYFDKLPTDKLRRELAVGAYLHRGDKIPIVRKAIRSLSKCEPPELPKKVANRKVITVYRAGEEDISKCKYRISWTTSKKVAIWFLQTYRSKHANHLYKAKIQTKDILAYSNDRQEFEVLQYNKVYDITDITADL